MLDKQISIEEIPVAVPQEEKLQEQVQVQQEPKISKRKQKRRITSYLSNISKQVEKNGNQINKTIIMIQSLQKQNQTKLTIGAGADKSQLQSLKQIKSQINQLQKQVARIQNDIQRIRTAPITRTRTITRLKSKSRKKASPRTATVIPRSKKSKLLK